MTYKPFVKVPNLTQAGCTRQNRPGRDALIDLGHGSLILRSWPRGARFHRPDPSGRCVRKNLVKCRALSAARQEVEPAEPEVTPLTLREPCPCCGGLMRIIEIFRRGQKPMSRAPPREQAA